ncbi:4-hydroxy-3-polyprenylbenzoate decarboxylase [Desulfonatronum thiosulfatophilum]|uniref:4-hydroxy-3-polyprenylbenzoate decarboxylase n=1 Tax=Desulfonatronum thiosulfatophilum TaxID=617002 RepID=A0A1G6EUD2_9BACT|nr:UbiD family decarboxylase [Desulfonatronum thiosulfatophilum]SDB61036.1 4-hydroxy-3-polyprenylbenzoate decarboxylase [Desulfonatronum thiosulfatophilum]
MDLRNFMDMLAENDQLLTISEDVDPFLEISALSAHAVREHGRALLFTNARNSRHPVLTNAFATEQRLALALGHDSLRTFGVAADQFLRRTEENLSAPLPNVDNPPCRERVHANRDVGFQHLPMMTFWPGDAGPCLTAAVVMTRHPETGQRNAGVYRIQIIDHCTATLGWHPGSGAQEHFAAASARGLPLEVAVAVGVPPAVLLAAALPLPSGIDELIFAAAMFGSELQLARCHTLDLLVPATSQFVLEGLAHPEPRAVEGPFGNHTGMQTTPRSCPVFKLQAITHGNNPIFQSIIAGPPPSESTWTAKVFEAMLRVRLQSSFPEILDLHLPLEGIFQNLLFVQIKAECKNTLEMLRALLDQPGLQRFRFLVAVDEAVDVRDTSQVLWRLGNCIDPARDMIALEGTLAPWHRTASSGFGQKLIFDARRKPSQQLIPPHPDPAFRQRIIQLWKDVQR